MATLKELEKRVRRLEGKKAPKRRRGKVSRKLSKASKLVIRYARKYQNKHPSAKWTTAMKHGGVEYRKRHC